MKIIRICTMIRSTFEYSYLSNKRRVANNRRVWKKYLNLIDEGSGTSEGPGIFETLYKIAIFFDFRPIFQSFFQKKINVGSLITA